MAAPRWSSVPLRWQMATAMLAPCVLLLVPAVLLEPTVLRLGAWSFAAAAAIGLGLWLGRRLGGQLDELTAALRSGEGFSGAGAGSPEAARAFEAVATQFAAKPGPQLLSLVGRLATASQDLVGAARELRAVVDEQAVDAQLVTGTIEELKRSAEGIGVSTRDVESTAQNARAAMEMAELVVAEVVERIGVARKQAMESVAAIGSLNHEATQVMRTAEVIKSIAEKSDLLALNAALEGVKAGEVGLGFSLIADEMRKLADSVGQSALEIRRLSQSIQEACEGAQARAGVGLRSSDEAVKVAERAFEGFQQVLRLTQHTSTVILQIAAANREQQSATDHALGNVNRIGSVLERASVATLRTHRVAGELATLVGALEEQAAGRAPAAADRLE